MIKLPPVELLACAFGTIALLAGSMSGTGILPAGPNTYTITKKNLGGFLRTPNLQNARHFLKQTNIARSKDGNLCR